MEPEHAMSTEIRVATFNASLNRGAEGQLVTDLSTPDNAQAQTVAEIIQHTDADIILINEFDFVENQQAATLFQNNYLSISQNGAAPVEYGYVYVAPSNTGIPSGFDLDNNGSVGGGNDAFGFGNFPGQYGMVVYSKYPIVTEDVRTFQNFLWKDMPGALLPDDPSTPAPQDSVLARGTGGLPAVVEEPLGHSGRGERRDRARAGFAPDTAGVRRARGPQRHPQSRRDPIVGRLRHTRQGRLHL